MRQSEFIISYIACTDLYIFVMYLFDKKVGYLIEEILR